MLHFVINGCAGFDIFLFYFGSYTSLEHAWHVHIFARLRVYVSVRLSLSFSLSLCVCGGDKAWCRASDFAYVQILCYKHIDVTLARVPATRYSSVFRIDWQNVVRIH